MNTPPDHRSAVETEPQPAAETPRPQTAGSPPSTKVAARPPGLKKPRLNARLNAPRKRPSVRPPTRPAPERTHATHTTYAAHPEETEGFFKRHAPLLGIGLLVAATGSYLYLRKPSPAAPPMKQERMVMVAPLPPPPVRPPPPPPPQQKPPEQKMEKEMAPAEQAKPIEKPAPAKAPDDPAPLGTNLKGEGGLAGLGSGSGIGGGTLGNGNGGGGGSRFGWYAGQVQSKISEALRSNPRTKSASLRIEVRIWPDTTGRITRAQLVGSTGDAALDGVIQNGVLTGLQLQEPPPAGMRLPIVLRLTARRPN